MREEILIRLNPTQLNQEIYIMSSASETIPMELKCTIDELPSVVAMSAAKYKIQSIKLAGATSFALGIKDKLTEKINTCFGKENKITIELM